MIRDTDQTICKVTYHESADSDDIATDWPTALELAIDHFSISDPRIKKMGCGITMLYEETEEKSREETPRVSIREQSIKEEQ